MRITILLIVYMTLTSLGITAQAHFPFDFSTTNAGFLNDRTWTIPTGKSGPPYHFPLPKATAAGSPDGRVLRFNASFGLGWWYRIPASGPGHQSDWNKLNTAFFHLNRNHSDDPCNVASGLNQNDVRARYKMHLGWRWSIERQKMELSLFYHESFYNSLYSGVEDKELYWRAHYIGDASLGDDENYVWMFISQKCLAMWVNGRALGIHRGSDYFSGDPDTISSSFNRTVYFGGSGVAPNDITISSDAMVHDDGVFDHYFILSNIQQWNLSRFMSGDSYVMQTAGTLIGSEYKKHPINNKRPLDQCSSHPEAKENYCTVHAGADIKFYAGEEVSLRPGFHAHAGSHFHAAIRSVSTAFPRTSTATETTVDEDLIFEQITHVNQEDSNAMSINNSSEYIEEFPALATAALEKSNDQTLASENLHSINLYPNPTTGSLAVHSTYESDMEMKILDIRGSMVYQTKISSSSSTEIELELDTGLYLVLYFYLEGGLIKEEKLVVE